MIMWQILGNGNWLVWKSEVILSQNGFKIKVSFGLISHLKMISLSNFYCLPSIYVNPNILLHKTSSSFFRIHSHKEYINHLQRRQTLFNPPFIYEWPSHSHPTHQSSVSVEILTLSFVNTLQWNSIMFQGVIWSKIICKIKSFLVW